MYSALFSQPYQVMSAHRVLPSLPRCHGTHDLLQKALMDLMRKRGYEAITIQDMICWRTIWQGHISG